SFRIVANPQHEQVGPKGDNHLDGYGIDAPIKPRQLQIKHLRACNRSDSYQYSSFKKNAKSSVIRVPSAT
ncbi:hypothetical protein, partial [Phocaeicola vulgatus]|uniref:hypothetical protein n=1 Tax=Phocaeicola vulgatus TaxID=821 RepID=UPI003F744CE9